MILHFTDVLEMENEPVLGFDMEKKQHKQNKNNSAHGDKKSEIYYNKNKSILCSGHL